MFVWIVELPEGIVATSEPGVDGGKHDQDDGSNRHRREGKPEPQALHGLGA